MNKKITIIAVIVAIIGIIGAVMFFGDKEVEPPKKQQTEQTKKPQQETEEVETVAPIVQKEEDIDEEITNLMINNNQGVPVSTFELDAKHFLVITKSYLNQYDKEFIGDRVLWVTKKGEEETYEQITNGDKLIKVIQTQKGPFLSVGNEKFVVIYEHVKYDNYALNEGGAVYKVKKDGKLESIFEIADEFEGIKVTKDSLTIKQKVYKDDYNQYPKIFKPYDLETYTYKKGEWELTDVKKYKANTTGNLKKEA